MLKTTAIAAFVLFACIAASHKTKTITYDGHKIELGSTIKPALPLVDVTIRSIRTGKVLDDDSDCIVITGTVLSRLDSSRYNITVDIELFGVFPDCSPAPQTDRYPSVRTTLEMVKPGKPVPWGIVCTKGSMSIGTAGLHYLVRASYMKVDPAFKN